MKVALFGSNGYTGQLLLKLLADHPAVTCIYAFSTAANEKAPAFYNNKIFRNELLDYAEIDNFDFEVVFSALPHLLSSKYISNYIGHKVIIDLSADYRMKDLALFDSIYGQLPAGSEHIGKSVYGLSEVYAGEIQNSELIACPGCYPTSVLLLLIPVLKEYKSIGNIVINSMSGISGAGKKAEVNLLFTERDNNVNVYTPGKNHRHLYEIREQTNYYSKDIQISFNPHLIPVSRGIYTGCTLISDFEFHFDEIYDIYRTFYMGKSFINLLPVESLKLKDVVATNNCNISIAVYENHLLLFSCIDNLLKGASGAALQNFNIRFGLPESTGLPVKNFL